MTSAYTQEDEARHAVLGALVGDWRDEREVVRRVRGAGFSVLSGAGYDAVVGQLQELKGDQLVEVRCWQGGGTYWRLTPDGHDELRALRVACAAWASEGGAA